MCSCRPVSAKPGPKVDPSFPELWKVLEELVEHGLVKSIGVSNFSPEKIESFMTGAKIRPSVNQVCLLGYSVFGTAAAHTLWPSMSMPSCP